MIIILIINRLAEIIIEKLKPRPQCVRTLIIKTIGHVQKGLNTSKFAHAWEGPYVFKEAYQSGYLNQIQKNACLY